MSPVNFTRERYALKDNHFVIGVDEAGRGPLAGPVVASAFCFFDECLISSACFDHSGVVSSHISKDVTINFAGDESGSMLDSVSTITKSDNHQRAEQVILNIRNGNKIQRNQEGQDMDMTAHNSTCDINKDFEDLNKQSKDDKIKKETESIPLSRSAFEETEQNGIKNDETMMKEDQEYSLPSVIKADDHDLGEAKEDERILRESEQEENEPMDTIEGSHSSRIETGRRTRSSARRRRERKRSTVGCLQETEDKSSSSSTITPTITSTTKWLEVYPWNRITDSKQILEPDREKIYELITKAEDHTVIYGSAASSPSEIDRADILQATLRSMTRAAFQVIAQIVARCQAKSDLDPDMRLKFKVLVDGNRRPPFMDVTDSISHSSISDVLNGHLDPQIWFDLDLSKRIGRVQHELIIKGDASVVSIAAASIIAKVDRDRELRRLAQEYPQYQLEVHKGYPTLEHRKLISTFGVSRIHRLSFNPILHGLETGSLECPSDRIEDWKAVQARIASRKPKGRRRALNSSSEMVPEAGTRVARQLGYRRKKESNPMASDNNMMTTDGVRQGGRPNNDERTINKMTMAKETMTKRGRANQPGPAESQGIGDDEQSEEYPITKDRDCSAATATISRSAANTAVTHRRKLHKKHTTRRAVTATPTIVGGLNLGTKIARQEDGSGRETASSATATTITTAHTHTPVTPGERRRFNKNIATNESNREASTESDQDAEWKQKHRSVRIRTTTVKPADVRSLEKIEDASRAADEATAEQENVILMERDSTNLTLKKPLVNLDVDHVDGMGMPATDSGPRSSQSPAVELNVDCSGELTMSLPVCLSEADRNEVAVRTLAEFQACDDLSRCTETTSDSVTAKKHVRGDDGSIGDTRRPAFKKRRRSSDDSLMNSNGLISTGG